MKKSAILLLLPLLSIIFGVAPLKAATWSGPDGYGYSGFSATYSWIDISGTGTPVPALSDDSFAGPFNIGFTFNFYGTNYTQFFVGSNGFISFDGGSTNLDNQCPLPNSNAPNNIIAIMWDDLYPNYTTGGVYYQTFANCPVGTGQCLVVEYLNWAHCCDEMAISGTFEAVLYASGNVLLQFQDSGSESGAESTTGIENNNAVLDYGLTYSCDTNSSITDHSAILFSTSGPATEVPTMTERGIIIFVVLAGLGAVYFISRQKTTKS
jgi:hypothetical protein